MEWMARSSDISGGQIWMHPRLGDRTLCISTSWRLDLRLQMQKKCKWSHPSTREVFKQQPDLWLNEKKGRSRKLTLARVGGGYKKSALAKEETKLMLADSPTYSLWFERFIRGMHNRMGNDIWPDEGVGNNLLHHMLNTLQQYLENIDNVTGMKGSIQLGCYLSATSSARLWGNELFNLNIKGLLEHDQEASDLGHGILPLLGRFKGETGFNYHLIPIAGET